VARLIAQVGVAAQQQTFLLKMLVSIWLAEMGECYTNITQPLCGDLLHKP
jgi:hypothetical protein